MLSNDFFSIPLTTKLTWNDLDVPKDSLSQIHEIEKWIKNSSSLLKHWGMKHKIKPGYRALFDGPSGIGKTLTAALLGKYTKRNVYKVDLSLVISKYIGETEKNLEKVFDKAENKDWILFIDEADSLFRKRTSVKDAHDRFANQEVSYLLQRIETFSGVVILSSNNRSNIDEAFLRRLNLIIYFPDASTEKIVRIKKT